MKLITILMTLLMFTSCGIIDSSRNYSKELSLSSCVLGVVLYSHELVLRDKISNFDIEKIAKAECAKRINKVFE
jgi:hypothetical protein